MKTVLLSFVAVLLFLCGCSNDQSADVIPETIPEGMVFVPGGTTTIGSDNGLPNERPVFETVVKPFFMDKNLVTVADYRRFVEKTGYVTEAEKFGNGVVFNFERGEWMLIDGVSWEYPNGPDNPAAEDNHPVRQVSWNDANAYLEWAGKRLPTEIEWEHAAKGGKNMDQPYAWGSSLIEQGRYMANTWTGTFPVENIAEDGYLQTSPVGEFNVTELGLTDMGGNVWEWTSDWYRSYVLRDRPYNPAPESEKVLRGGSFMCNVSYCHGYRVSARSHTTPDNAIFHVGFRGVKDAG
ncbi:MAG: formylglycine-generating enzyme family protein [Balneolaceae bacterium]|nr:MAG: formylglycine-generating enzyme family protein [Balneolaceae bacterium]